MIEDVVCFRKEQRRDDIEIGLLTENFEDIQIQIFLVIASYWPKMYEIIIFFSHLNDKLYYVQYQ